MVVRKEIELNVKELVERLEYCLRNNLEDWAEIPKMMLTLSQILKKEILIYL